MTIALGLVAAFVATAAPAAPELRSPDRRVAVTFGADVDGQPTYRVLVNGREVIAPSALGLEFERYAKLSNGLVLQGADVRAGEDRYTLPAGKVSAVDERYNEVRLHYAEAGTARRRLDLVVRAYDTGVALRYRIPPQPTLTQLRLVNEVTQFAFPADYACTGLNLGTFGTSHEGEFDPVQASAIRAHNLFELPLVCHTGAGGPAIAIAEPDVDTWPSADLTGTEAGGLGVVVRLTRRPDDPGIAVRVDVGNGLQSPWRVVMIAPEPGKLIENTLLTSLNPPARGDFSWVEPGKTAWDWWSGPVLSAVARPATDDATERGFIDFAASLKLPYMMIDDGWYVHSGEGAFLNSGADPTRPIDAIHLPELVRYAGQRGLGLILWIHWKLLDEDMERILAQVQAWGVKGVKVDFMNWDDQEMIGFYHRLAEATARHHLLLDLHGAAHPWGMTRTWPNFITQEGVFGAEYNKWTRRVTARHNVNLAYTRMLTGPMDYTPGAYRNCTPEAFRPTPVAPEVQTTRGATLAMYVVFDSPLQSVADSPDAYRGQPGLDFLSAVPASWDETRFLSGTLGDYVAIARRKGKRWYVGAMTNETGRTVTLPLAFLGRGRFSARSWSDGTIPTDLVSATRTVTRTDLLTLALAPSGGAAAILEPAR